MTETSTVRFEVRGIERAHGGRVVALAIVALDVDGVELVMQGVQVLRAAGGGLEVRAPMWRHPTGRWIPAVVLPDELRDAIGAEVLARIFPDGNQRLS